ncbi:glycosyltransferase family 2 protein [Sphingomonas sp. ac-8]|uniref:glycosyltransferase family 2 protein n=1 Tax=Sphingomonas sp. ac-8 TaxID=3242977 RepID=UPI003A7FAD49
MMPNANAGRGKVLILLSTWNGTRYLTAQIDSLLAQDVDGGIHILVRDDGSSDGTIDDIRNLGDPRIELVEGENLGARGSFFSLLRMAQARDAEFVALCDQDDVWRVDKLARAIAMVGSEQPALYASSLDLVDDNLASLGKYTHPGDRSFTATLFVNFVTGCTCVMNRTFLQRLVFPQDDAAVLMHDWWLASIATLGARIVYDPVSGIQYRQHAANHVGIRMGVGKIVEKGRSLMRRKSGPTRFDHAGQFLRAAENRMSDDQQLIVRDFLRTEHSRVRRMRFVRTHRLEIDLPRKLLFVLFG